MVGGIAMRARVLECGGPGPLARRRLNHTKVPEDWRSPRPRGVFTSPNRKQAMKTSSCQWILQIALVSVSVGAWAASVAPAIRVNSLGFLPDQLKQASVAAAATNFVLIRTSDAAVVFTDSVSAPRTNADTGEALFTADFSAFTNTGVFQIEVPGAARSAPFSIGTDIYREPFVTVTRAMYLWRCGVAVSGTHQGRQYRQGICHTNDAWLDYVGGAGIRSNSLGGWHDAGDYNKYVCNAGVTVGCLFRAWEDFRPAIQKLTLALPEGGGRMPEFLAEIKWELDWLFSMQAPDGSVYHKVSTTSFGGFIMPEQETARRYFTPWSSAATADFVALLAAGSRHLREFDPAYADRCLAAARRSYAFLLAHPQNQRANLTNFSTGTYQNHDADDRIWAAAEMWDATGETNFLHDFESRVRNRDQGFEVVWDWGNVRNLGLLTYLFSTRPGREAALVESLRASLLSTAEDIVNARAAHGYARPLGERYSWGGNGTVARQTLVLHAAHRLDPKKPEYRKTALDALGYLFGRNPFGRSFVTGVGHQPPMHPHDRRSGADGIAAPWPGYLVGGPNPKATDWQDVEEDYRTNEIAINWNGALIYALAMFLEPPQQQ
jgi:endoglucanase